MDVRPEEVVRSSQFRGQALRRRQGSEWKPGTLWTRQPRPWITIITVLVITHLSAHYVSDTHLSALHIALVWAPRCTPERKINVEVMYQVANPKKACRRVSEEIGPSRAGGRQDCRIKLECFSFCSLCVCCYLSSTLGGLWRLVLYINLTEPWEPRCWSNTLLGISVRMFLDVINTKIDSMSETP